MLKSYRLAPLACAFMGGVFIFAGIFTLAVPGSFGIGSSGLRIGCGVWAIFLGLLVGVLPFRAKLIVSDESISETNFKGKVETCLKWSEIVDFQFEKTVTVKGSQYNVYQLVTSDGRKLEIADNFGGWDEVRQIVLTHLPNAARLQCSPMWQPLLKTLRRRTTERERSSWAYLSRFG